jgi:exopolyphosphatase/guanosine-5'-triphosphate,3'-diphosphate pyrophosphatase
MTHSTFAAIDIGSNAFRLLISYVERGVGATAEFKKAAFIRVPVRLGEDVFTSGHIGHEKRHKLVEAMRGFARLLEVFDVQAYKAYATSAMREAQNGAEIAAEIEKESGIKVEIVSGQEEAETIFEAGDIAGLMSSDKPYLYVDVGGGSTEVTVYSNHRRACSESFALGTVRIIAGAVREGERERFKKWLREIRSKYHPEAIIGSGGNINKIDKLLSGSKKNRGKDDPLHYGEMKVLATKLSKMSYDERIERFGLNDYRADVIIPALDIFLTAARTCRIDEVIVPKIGLVDGIIHKLYTQGLKK